MADPVSTGLPLAAKLIGFSIAAGQAIWTGGLVKDAKAVKSLIEVGDALRTVWKARHRDASDIDVLARHIALVGAAFITAWRDQDPDFKAGLEAKPRKVDVKAGLATGLETPIDVPWSELLQRDPTASPVYQRLWALFGNSEHDLLTFEAHDFARLFRLVWAQLLATDAGRAVRVAIMGALDAQGRQIRRLVAQDMVRWRAEPLLGDADATLETAPVSLQAMYVEPSWGEVNRKGQPILESLIEWLADGEHLAGAVTAPFGHGKSLTSRMLTSRLADEWLAAPPGSGRWFPICVPCRQVGFDAQKLRRTMLRALKAQLGRLGTKLSTDKLDERWPDDGGRTLLILDGLDEVHLRPSAQKDLVEAIDDLTSVDFRVLIFTRPTALPRELKNYNKFPLRSFTEVQIEQWLVNWNGSHSAIITRDALHARDLLQLARTPILLYMIARSWADLPDEKIPEVKVYQVFFELLATTKLDLTQQPVVLKTAEEILRALVEREQLADDAGPKEGLLWLLARLAWEHAREQAVDKPLTRMAIERLLHKELGIEDEIGAVTSGLMLVMRADPELRNPPFDFSHERFKEYLIAHHWQNEIMRTMPDERKLMGAQLIVDEGRAAPFLIGLLRMMEPEERERAALWAEKYALDPRLGWRQDGRCDDPVSDERWMVREAALLIRTTLGSEPLVFKQADALAALVRGAEVQGRSCHIRAAGIVASGLRLQGANLQGADLGGADLGGAELQRADLGGANLGGADLWGAHLQRAGLGGAELGGADLWGAHLGGADLWGAHLKGADLGGADLQGANFRRANLQRTDMQGADVWGADLTNANLGTGNERVFNLHLAKNLDNAIRPEGWGDLLTNPHIKVRRIGARIQIIERFGSLDEGVQARFDALDRAGLEAIYEEIFTASSVEQLLDLAEAAQRANAATP